MNEEEIVDSLNKKIKIDEHNLDLEFTRHPELFRRIADLHANAQIEQSSVKVDIENAETDLYILYRQQAEDEQQKEVDAGNKPERITDVSINRRVNASKKLRDLQRKLLGVSARVMKLGALKESYQQRGYALNNLTSLYTANYWQRESGGKLRSEVRDEIADKTRAETGKLRRKQRGD